MSDLLPEPGEMTAPVEPGQLPVVFSDRPWPHPWMGRFLDALAASPNASAAAQHAGVNRQYAYTCRERFPDFGEAWEQARLLGADVLEANMLRWATVGKDIVEQRERFDAQGNLIERTVVRSKLHSPTIALAMLRRWKPEYRDSHVLEHTGAGGGPVRVDVDRAPSRERILELARLAQEFGLPDGVPPVIEGGHVNGDKPDE